MRAQAQAQLQPQIRHEPRPQPAPPHRAPEAAPEPVMPSGSRPLQLPLPPQNPPFVAPPQPSPAPPNMQPHPAQQTLQPHVPSRWAIFEQLGLGPPKPKAPRAPGQPQLSQKTAKLLVTAYRVLGFGILSIIVIVLVGYIATSAFYFVSDSWIQPMVVSPTDERVLALESQLAQHENTRDQLEADLHHSERYIEVQQAFQAQFADAIRADLVGRKKALRRLEALAKEYEGARQTIQSSNRAYANASRKRMSQEYRAGLIDRGDMLSGKFQLAQIANSNLTLAERQAEYETRAAELELQATALDTILGEKGGDGVLSYDVLRIKQEYELSRLETAKAIENRKILQSSLERQEVIVESLRQSPYLRAIAENANVAFVPYGNMDNVSVGASVYGCHLEMLFCGEVGKVVEILPGEVAFKHPHREKVLRGQMISIELEETEDAEDDVLFVGGRPLLL